MIFDLLLTADNYLWAYLALPLLLGVGLYLTCKTRFLQLRQVPFVLRTFMGLLKFWKPPPNPSSKEPKGFISTMGGCTGIGNVVAICVAIQLGGPGALFWIWVTALAGMTLKYAEVYLGVRFRETTHTGEVQGGPMYYLKRVFKSPAIPTLVCLMLCIYGTEIFQFSVMANSLSVNLQLSKTAVVIPLLLLIVGASTSFSKKLHDYALFLVPFFFIAYFSMTLFILFWNITAIPQVLVTILTSAFTGHAAIGAFAGSSLIMTISHGIRRGCYAGDVGIGYAAVIHSRDKDAIPEHQASLAVFDIFLDSFIICSSSVVLVIVTGVWMDAADPSLLIQMALGQYFPYMDIFMPAFILLLGFTTTSTYFTFGLSCAEHLHPKLGRKVYYTFATIFLAIFAYFDTNHSLLIMSLFSGLLLIINLFAIYKLRHEVCFKLPCEQSPQKHAALEPAELSREIA